MRGWMVISVLALVAGCGEHRGWNPNYMFGNAPYGDYRAQREVALLTRQEEPRTIPIASPGNAPTAEAIAGQGPVPVPPTMRVRVVQPGETVPAATAPAARDSNRRNAALVQYALAVRHQPGEPVYSRAYGSVQQAQKACAAYRTPDDAQLAFLAAGGPQQDTLGVDPDGDGFACGWNPAPFRNATGAAPAAAAL
jgi:hypothetical protein